MPPLKEVAQSILLGSGSEEEEFVVDFYDSFSHSMIHPDMRKGKLLAWVRRRIFLENNVGTMDILVDPRPVSGRWLRHVG